MSESDIDVDDIPWIGDESAGLSEVVVVEQQLVVGVPEIITLEGIDKKLKESYYRLGRAR